MRNPLFQFIVAAFATIFFGVTFQVPRRHFIACGIVGAVGWVTYLACHELGDLSAATATLVAVLPLAALCRVFAIRFRAPVTLFLLCGIFPLVPGAGIYYTAYYFLQDEGALCAERGFETLKIALAIAFGIALVSALPLPRHRSLGPRK